MADTESGAKWWFRYVIVPILGGSGVVAITVAALIQHDRSKAEQAQSKPTISSPQSVEPDLPTDKRYHGEKSSEGPIDFAVYNLDDSQRYPGSEIYFSKWTYFLVKWNIDPHALKGSLLFSDEASDGHYEASEPLKHEVPGGQCDVHPGEEITLQLFDVRTAKDRRLLKKIVVHCGK